MLDKQNAKASRILGITNDILYKQGFDKIRAVYDAFMDGKSFFSQGEKEEESEGEAMSKRALQQDEDNKIYILETPVVTQSVEYFQNF